MRFQIDPGVRSHEHQFARLPRRAPSTLSRIQRTLGPRSRWPAAGPTFLLEAGLPPSRENSSTSHVRAVSCHMRALAPARRCGPAPRAVSRWLRMPPAMSPAPARLLQPPRRSPPARVTRSPPHRARPARLGTDLLVFLLVDADHLAAWSKIMHRVLVVPWSIAAAQRHHHRLRPRAHRVRVAGGAGSAWVLHGRSERAEDAADERATTGIQGSPSPRGPCPRSA